MSAWTVLGPVVVGVSGSADSDQAVDWAADFAALTQRRLLVVHAGGYVDVRPSATELVEVERAASDAGRAVVDAAVQRAVTRHPDLVATGVLEVGDPPGLLLEHAADAAAVVVGSRRGEGRLPFLGSVSLAVARHARCPAIVVRAASEPGPLGERVVLGVDGTAASRGAAEFAFGYASLTGLPLVILHGSWERAARGSSVLRLLGGGEEHGPTDEEQLSIAETIAGLPETYPDVQFRDVHRSTDPAAALIEASGSARLLVVGSRHHGTVTSMLLRSISTPLVEHAHSPVAVVHTPA